VAKRRKRKPEDFAAGVGRALLRAAKDAERLGQMFNVPL